MNIIQEIEASLPSLSIDDLHHIERMIHALYRARHEPVIYDDAYGIWTEYDQISAASEVFEILDKQEDMKHNDNA
jgi:hypothetical protein